jgi:hypothetical protein
MKHTPDPLASAKEQGDAIYIRYITGNLTYHPSLLSQEEAFGPLGEDEVDIHLHANKMSRDYEW